MSSEAHMLAKRAAAMINSAMIEAKQTSRAEALVTFTQEEAPPDNTSFRWITAVHQCIAFRRGAPARRATASAIQVANIEALPSSTYRLSG